jgi:hypothetical protein
MLRDTAPVMRVTALVVDGRPRRRGVGKLLMDHAEHLAATAGCEAVELTSAVGRTEAHAFYRSIGYEANSLRFRKMLASPECPRSHWQDSPSSNTDLAEADQSRPGFELAVHSPVKLAPASLLCQCDDERR